MSTIEETTPLLFPGPFYLPVVLPPDRFWTIPTNYYKELKEQGVLVTAASANPTAPLEITVDGADVKQERKDGTELKLENVYALTAGFASLEQGHVVLRLWPSHFRNLVKSPIGQRPNRVVYGSLSLLSIEAAFKEHVAALPRFVPEIAWRLQNPGSTPLPSRADLQKFLLGQFMQGKARIYVEAGAALGTGSRSGSEMSMTFSCFFDPDDPQLPTIAIPVEDLIDNVQEPGRFLKFGGHPLVEAVSDFTITVNFTSRFQIWNNATHAYEPFAGHITLLATPPVPVVPEDFVPSVPIAVAHTNPFTGQIHLPGTVLPGRATIRFRYATTGLTVGNRTFDADIETDPHKARSHVDANFVNDHTYRAKYEVYPRYQAFIDDIAAQGEMEPLQLDRGNADDADQSKPTELLSLATAIEVLEVVLPDSLEPRIAFSQHELHAQIAGCEAFYKLDDIPSPADTFNLLVEGDSWTNYPLAFNDLYSHLDNLLQRQLLGGKSYNRIPLQHFGDRGDQMFVTVPGQTRQFDFTCDFLDEYPVDLIFCSAGGNDFAEPGISAYFDVEPFNAYINDDGYFDPYAAAQDLTPAELAQAKALMEISFAVLLKNHPWNLFLNGLPISQQKDEPTLRAELEQLVLNIGGDFGPTVQQIEDEQLDPSEVLQEIGTKVIANFPDDPDSATSPAAKLLLEAVFDLGPPSAFADARYTAIEARWRLLLKEAKKRGIPVLSHAYGYPLFSEAPASLLGLGRRGLSGPWFTRRFAEANIRDQRVQKMCLKAFLDRITLKVFDQFKTDYDFDYVDSRNANSEVERWRDELHLKSPGYTKIAKELFGKVQQRWPAFFKVL